MTHWADARAAMVTTREIMVARMLGVWGLIGWLARQAANKVAGI